jgi:hypothetical protein
MMFLESRIKDLHEMTLPPVSTPDRINAKDLKIPKGLSAKKFICM